MVAIGGRDLDGMSDKELARHVSVVLTDRIEPELMTCWEVVAAGRYPYTNHFGKLSREDQLSLIHISTATITPARPGLPRCPHCWSGSSPWRRSWR